MKKAITFALCLCLICSLTIPAFAFDSPSGGNLWKAAKENVNVRTGPSTNYTSLGILNTSEIFLVSEEDYQGSNWDKGYAEHSTNIWNYYHNLGWSEVKGYVYSQYLGRIF